MEEVIFSPASRVPPNPDSPEGEGRPMVVAPSGSFTASIREGCRQSGVSLATNQGFPTLRDGAVDSGRRRMRRARSPDRRRALTPYFSEHAPPARGLGERCDEADELRLLGTMAICEQAR